MGNKSGKGKAGKVKGNLKILMLGISGSGKSTFAKQMKILHLGGFSDEEVSTYKLILRMNAFIGMKELIKQTEKIEHKVNEENRKHARYFLEKQLADVDAIEWNSSLVNKFSNLWKDPAIQQVWTEANLYQLQISNMDYMITNLDRISAEEFIPTHNDILLARQRTTGVTTIEFVKSKYKFQLIDVGGQVPERAKWEKILQEEINAVIFFAGLDEFNMTSADDRAKTKMEVSLGVWKELQSHETMKTVCSLLFLNKLDLLEIKLKQRAHFSALRKHYPAYKGSSNLDEVVHFIQQLFTASVPEGVETHVHVVCAIDTDMMKTVFETVKENIFMHRMDSFLQ